MRKNLLWIHLTILLILSSLSINMIEIAVAQVDHDVAVISVTPDPAWVEVGELLNITVVVENQGTESETFNITAYHDTTAIETQKVTNLASGTKTTLTFNWNTTDLFYNLVWHPGTYTVNATASTVPGETDTEDNTLVSLTRVRVSRHPYVAVVPHCTVDPALTPGQNYMVSIRTDYNGTDVWGWQLTLSYNPNVLEGIKVVNGDLITNATHPGKAEFLPKTFNNTIGKLGLTAAWFYYTTMPVPLTSGPGTLANVTFTVVGTGDSDITLGDETKLFGWTEGGAGDQYNIVSHFEPAIGHLLPGFFQNTEERVIHDIAVTNVTLSSTSVATGELPNITVAVENQGTVTEIFDVEVCYARSEAPDNYWSIEKKTGITLEAGANTSLTFAWNTTGKAGTYIIRAVASSVSGEEDTGNNALKSNDTLTVAAPQAPPGLPIETIIVIVVVVAAIGALAAYAVKRRKKPTPE
jgi:hypothetical protein